MDRPTDGFAPTSQKPKSKGKAGSEMKDHNKGLKRQRTPTGCLSMIYSLLRPVVTVAAPLGKGRREEKCSGLRPLTKEASSHSAATLLG